MHNLFIAFRRSLLGLVGTCVLLSGCARPPAVQTPGRTAAKQQDTLQSAVEIFRTSTAAPQFREALALVDQHLARSENRAEVQMSKEERDLLKEQFHLTQDELDMVSAADFTALDAHHVEQCFLLRDAARALEQQGLEALEQAKLCLDWVCRQVLLREGTDLLTPPLYVLQRGHGTARERALVLVALLGQFQIPAVVLAWPEATPGGPRTVLVAILDGNEQKAIYLFDPRLGRPLSGGAGKGMATLAQLRKDPALFKTDAKSAPELLVACPLEALSPRMRFLEKELSAHENVTLAVDPRALIEQFAKASGEKVGVWNAVADAGAANSPVRMLRQFLPPAKGGTDRTGRLDRLESQRIPWPAVLHNYADMKILVEGMPAEVTPIILGFTRELFLKYAQAPHEAMLRGSYSKAVKRLTGIRQVFEAEEMVAGGDDEFNNHLKHWRQAVRDAYLAVRRHEPQAQEMVDRLWKTDHYLYTVLQAQEEPDLKRHRKTILTTILLKGVRDTLGEQTDYLLTQVWHEKAERVQTRVDRQQQQGKKGRPQVDVADGWRNLDSWSGKYQARFGVDLAALPGRLDLLRAGQVKLDSAQWDRLWTELQRSAAARLKHATALERLGNSSEARAQLATLDEYLKMIQENARLKKELASDMEAARRNPVALAALESLDYDLGLAGSFAALRQQTQELLQTKAK